MLADLVDLLDVALFIKSSTNLNAKGHCDNIKAYQGRPSLVSTSKQSSIVTEPRI